jgi:hypothetical protein
MVVALKPVDVVAVIAIEKAQAVAVRAIVDVVAIARVMIVLRPNSERAQQIVRHQRIARLRQIVPPLRTSLLLAIACMSSGRKQMTDLVPVIVRGQARRVENQQKLPVISLGHHEMIVVAKTDRETNGRVKNDLVPMHDLPPPTSHPRRDNLSLPRSSLQRLTISVSASLRMSRLRRSPRRTVMSVKLVKNRSLKAPSRRTKSCNQQAAIHQGLAPHVSKRNLFGRKRTTLMCNLFPPEASQKPPRFPPPERLMNRTNQATNLPTRSAMNPLTLPNSTKMDRFAVGLVAVVAAADAVRAK